MSTTTDTTANEVLSPEQQYAKEQAVAALAHTHKAPIDQAFGRPNDRPNRAAPPSLFDAIEPAMQPSMTLDPQQIRAHEQFEALEGYACEPAVQAMEALHKAARDLIAVREATRTDVTMTEAAQVLAVDELHGKLMKQALAKADAAEKGLDRAIETAEQALRAAIKDGATGPFAAEIRSMVRSMSDGDRMKFLNRVVNDNDGTALGAILGAPSYLSNVDAKLAQTLTERANRIRQPQLASRLALMEHARTKLQEASGSFMRTTDQLIGARSGTVERLKASKAKIKSVIGAVVPA